MKYKFILFSPWLLKSPVGDLQWQTPKCCQYAPALQRPNHRRECHPGQVAHYLGTLLDFIIKGVYTGLSSFFAGGPM